VNVKMKKQTCDLISFILTIAVSMVLIAACVDVMLTNSRARKICDQLQTRLVPTPEDSKK